MRDRLASWVTAMILLVGPAFTQAACASAGEASTPPPGPEDRLGPDPVATSKHLMAALASYASGKCVYWREGGGKKQSEDCSVVQVSDGSDGIWISIAGDAEGRSTVMVPRGVLARAELQQTGPGKHTLVLSFAPLIAFELEESSPEQLDDLKLAVGATGEASSQELIPPRLTQSLHSYPADSCTLWWADGGKQHSAPCKNVSFKATRDGKGMWIAVEGTASDMPAKVVPWKVISNATFEVQPSGEQLLRLSETEQLTIAFEVESPEALEPVRLALLGRLTAGPASTSAVQGSGANGPAGEKPPPQPVAAVEPAPAEKPAPAPKQKPRSKAKPVPAEAWPHMKDRNVVITKRDGTEVRAKILDVKKSNVTLVAPDGLVIVLEKRDAVDLRVSK